MQENICTCTYLIGNILLFSQFHAFFNQGNFVSDESNIVIKPVMASQIRMYVHTYNNNNVNRP